MTRQLLTAIIFLSLVATAAANLGISLPDSNENVSLQHSQSTSITTPLSPPSNSVCSLNCDYELSLNEQIREADLFTANDTTTTQVGPISVRAPPRTERYGRSGQRQYTLSVSCTEAPWCGDQQQTVSTPITVNYQLTEARQQRYQELTRRITNATTKLTEATNNVADLNDTLQSLPDNVALTPVTNRLNELNDEAEALSTTVANARQERTELSYQFGLDILGNTAINDITTLQPSLDDLANQTTTRINQHNTTATQINTVRDDLQRITNAAAAANLRENATSAVDAYESLTAVFNDGSFQAYQTVQDRLQTVNQTTQSLFTATNDEAQRIVDRAQTVINDERNTTCPTCNISTPTITGGVTSQINQACTYLTQTLPDAYDEINHDRQTQYEERITDTNQTNTAITQYNNAIKPVNDIINQTNRLSQNNYLNVNTTACRTQIQAINDQQTPNITALNNTRTECDRALSDAERAANQSRGFWSQLSYLLSDIYTSYEFNLALVEPKQPFPEPQPPTDLTVTNTTASFTDTTCSWDELNPDLPRAQTLN